MLGTADDARLHDLGKALAAGAAMATLQHIEQACSQGVAAGQLAEQLLGYFRDLMLATVGCPAEMQRHAGESLHGELKALGQQWGLQTVLAILGMIDHALVRIRHSLHGRVLLESTLVQICHLPNLQAVSDLAASLGGGKSLVAARPGTVDQKKKLEPLAPATSSPTQPAISQTEHDLRPPVAAATVASNASPSLPPLSSRPAAPQAAVGPGGPNEGPISRFDPGAAKPGIKPADSTVPTSGSQLPARPAVAAKSRAQMMREVELDPYVQSCLEIFGGEIVRIDPPRPPNNTTSEAGSVVSSAKRQGANA